MNAKQEILDVFNLYLGFADPEDLSIIADKLIERLHTTLPQSQKNLDLIDNFLLFVTHMSRCDLPEEGPDYPNHLFSANDLYQAALDYIEEDHVDGKEADEFELKVGVRVRVVDSNREDETFDNRFAGKTGIIVEERPFGNDPKITWFSVEFNPEQFDPNTPVPDNCIEDEEYWKERLQRKPLVESFWPEELIHDSDWHRKLGYDKPRKYAYVRIKEMYDGYEFTSSVVMQVFHYQTMEAKADLYVSDFRDCPDDDDPVREKNEEGWYEQNNGSLVKVEYLTEISKEEYDIMNKYL